MHVSVVPDEQVAERYADLGLGGTDASIVKPGLCSVAISR